MVDRVHAAIESIARMPQPVVARVQGAVAGFGLSLMNACDLVFAADDAYFASAYLHHRRDAGRRRDLLAAADRRRPQGRGDHAARRAPVRAAGAGAGPRQPRGAGGRSRRRRGRRRGQAGAGAAAARCAAPSACSASRAAPRSPSNSTPRRRASARAPAPTISPRASRAFLDKRPPSFGGARRRDPHPSPATRSSSPAPRAASGSRSRCARRATAPTSRSSARPQTPHPKLPGTIHEAARAVEAAGGHALAIACDVRDEDAVARAVAATVARFGGIDILVNNASAISLTGTLATPVKRFDLMMGVNVRGTFVALAGVPAAPARVGARRAQPAHPDPCAAADAGPEVVPRRTSPTRSRRSG